MFYFSSGKNELLSVTQHSPPTHTLDDELSGSNPKLGSILFNLWRDHLRSFSAINPIRIKYCHQSPAYNS